MPKPILKASVFAVLAVSLLMGQASKPSSISAANFIGEWKVGVGVASETFTITLEKAEKQLSPTALQTAPGHFTLTRRALPGMTAGMT